MRMDGPESVNPGTFSQLHRQAPEAFSKTMNPQKCMALALGLSLVGAWAGQAGEVALSGRVVRSSEGVRLEVPNPPVAPVAGTRLQFSYESSTDLRSWMPGRDLVPDGAGNPGVDLSGNSGQEFFRVRTLRTAGGSTEPADRMGYNRTFVRELDRLGQISADQFRQRFGTNGFLDRISFDPTTARFWDLFSVDPDVFNASVPPGGDKRLYDFRLNPQEMGSFLTNGFVVSERLGSYSFADVYYKVFTDDLPVFISTDSVLHAWHFSFQKALEELEETWLAVQLGQLFDQMAGSLAELEVAGWDPQDPSVRDADLYLAVARSLIHGQPVSPVWANPGEVDAILAKIRLGQFDGDFGLWGRQRMMDFSQFTVRGHYTSTPQLQRYFQAFMWGALADFEVVGPIPNPQTCRELKTSLILLKLAQSSGQWTQWQSIRRLLQLTIGTPNALTLEDLTALGSPSGPPTREDLIRIQLELLEGKRGIPAYASAPFFGSATGTGVQIPPTFSFTGKGFLLDGWAQSKLVYSNIRWVGPGVPDRYRFGDAVIRRFPSALDVVFSVFGNNGVVEDLYHRIQDPSGVPFRDGLPYQHNLSAIRLTVDQLTTATWNESIYSRWLDALRTLTATPLDPRLPEAMRTRAWAMKDANTQSASWTQLRHDTLLYAAEPYTGMIACDYPAGFVELRPEFWSKMEALARFTAEVLTQCPISGALRFPDPRDPFTVIGLNLGDWHVNRIRHFQNFANVMRGLGTLSQKEADQIPFTADETLFIRSVMNNATLPYYGKTFSGWYPGLFYKGFRQGIPQGNGASGVDVNGSDRVDHLVVGVHTAPPDLADPEGGVLHEGVGGVDLLMIAVDNGPHRTVYAGPTMSHYEFIEKGPSLSRLTDQAWSARLSSGPRPARPDWTRSYLVPR